MAFPGPPLPIAIIAGEKAISAIGIWALAALALLLHHHVHEDPLALLVWRHTVQSLSLTGHRAIVRWAVGLLPPLGPRLFLAVGILLSFWGALLGAEAVGFWFHYGWGELLIIVETAALIPIEVWHLVAHPHPTSLLPLAINLVILWYVIALYARRFLAANAGRRLVHAVFGREPHRAQVGPGRAQAADPGH